MTTHRAIRIVLLLVIFTVSGRAVLTQPQTSMQGPAQTPRMASVTPPEKFFGFQMGADRKMARWDKLVEYYNLLAKESPKIKVVNMGPTTMGNPFLMYLAKKAAAVSVQLGQGRVVLIGFRAQHRAQTHGTYKVVFNALLEGPGASPARTTEQGGGK